MVVLGFSRGEAKICCQFPAQSFANIGDLIWICLKVKMPCEKNLAKSKLIFEKLSQAQAEVSISPN